MRGTVRRERMHFKEVKGILSAGNGMNLYRGCTHGCIYCDSRSLCYQMDHDFEDIEVKSNAVELLEDALRRKRAPCMISTGAMTDPYLHAETSLRHTRRSLEVIERYGFGVAIQTKSARILEDIDLLRRINERAKCVVEMTLTTYDDELCRILEPHVSVTSERFAVLEAMRDAGIPTVVWLSPLLPFINDTEENLRGVMDYCVRARVRGVICFGIGMTLRDGDREYYYAQLDRHFPGLSARYRQKYGNRYELVSDNHARLMPVFFDICQRHGIMSGVEENFAYLRTFESRHEGEQLTLF